MSRQYIVNEDGEPIEDIAAIEYGDPALSSLLWDANPSLNTPLVKGQTVIIPGEPPADRLTGKEPDDLTIIVNGREIPVLSARILRTMDTGTDGWTARMAWTPGADPELDKATRPYGYPRAAAYIGNVLQVGGCLYGTEPKMDDSGVSKTLTGYSFTADAVDSHVPGAYQRENVTLEQVAAEMGRILGIKAVFDVDSGGAFARATCEESDTIFGHLRELASQRGLLVANTPQGDLLFHRAVTEGEPVGTLSEDQPLVTEWKANYDGRLRFHTYKCIQSGATSASLDWSSPDYGKSTNSGPSTLTTTDPAVPRSRAMTFRADDATPGNITDASRWRKNKQIVAALTQELTVSSWYAPNGSLWEPNTLVSVVSAVLGVPKGFTFLIRAVEFVLEDRRTAVLHLVPPQAYSRNRDIGEVWS